MTASTAFAASGGINVLVREASAHPLLQPEEEERLTSRLSSGDAGAARELVKRNLRIAVDEAILHRALGVPQAKLIRMGVAALGQASKSYEPEVHGGFSEHARRVVRSAIVGALEAS